jgi:hypothetical protein
METPVLPTWNAINGEQRFTDDQNRFWLARPATLDRVHQVYCHYQSLYGIGYARVRNRVLGLWIDADSFEPLDYGSGWDDPDPEMRDDFSWAVKIRPEYLIVMSSTDGSERKLITTSFAPSAIVFWHTDVADLDMRYAR